MELLTSPDAWIALFTLTALEIVLGIDNLVFISILSGALPESERPKARRLGLALAVITRIIFLLGIGVIMRLQTPLFPLFGHGVSGKDLILLIGGLFLVAKATLEIHAKLEGEEHQEHVQRKAATISAVVGQIMVIDLVFSIDSVITAVGMVKWVEVMIAAVLISVGVMMVFVNRLSDLVERHPTIKVLALSFLVLIGVNLIAEGMGQHISKGYTYFAMAFSVIVEMLNIRIHRASTPVKLRHGYPSPPDGE